MKELWQEFEDWLSIHWPEAIHELNPPATDAEISLLESRLGFELSPDFRSCLKVHNGQRAEDCSIFEGFKFLSTDEIYVEWSIWKELLDSGEFEEVYSAPDEGIKDNWWNAKWVPFSSNGGGDHFCIDLDPDSSGNSGQVITMWHDMEGRELKAASFSAYLKDYIDGIRSGKYVYSEDYDALIDAEEI